VRRFATERKQCLKTLAQQKFACPACGAEAIWNPAKQALICPFCGTTSPATLDPTAGGILEHDLVTALRSITDDKRGWQTEKRYVKCQSCRPFRCSIRTARRSAVNSAAPHSWSRMSRPRMRFGRKACFLSR